MKELNRTLTQLIGQCPRPTILGLLPVETSLQEQALRLVKESIHDSFNQLFHDLIMQPALTSYAIAVAIGRGNTEANFYLPLAAELGITLGQNQRPKFASQFAFSCHQLGMVMPEQAEETHADRYIRDVIFQAGILPYWIDPLATAIRSFLSKNPCPDLEDDEQIRRFSQFIAERVPQAQTRLRRTLRSEVGPLVCRAILEAFVSDDYNRLPPHYREPMRQTFEHTIKDRIQSPYLSYNAGEGTLQLILPKQSSRLVSHNSCWAMGGNTYSALIEKSLEISDLAPGPQKIRLMQLRNQFEDQIYTVKLAPDQTEPFFLFRARDGKRLTQPLRPEIELPLGDYCLLLAGDCTTSEDAELAEWNGFKTASLEIFPERAPLEIKAGSASYVLRPRLGSEFVIKDNAGKWLETVEGEEIYYGAQLSVQAFAPANSDGQSPGLSYVIEAIRSAGTPSATGSLNAGEPVTGHVRYDLTMPVRQFLAGLPPWIYEVYLKADCGLRSFSRHFVYWKGLERTTKSFGYVCTTPPANFSPNNSIGVRSAERGIEICKDHHGPEVVISTSHPDKSFRLAKPGLWLRLFDPEKLENEAVPLGTTIEVAGQEQLIIESGDTISWEIKCQQQTLTVLRPGQAKRVLNLGPLLSQFGESLSLQARNEANRELTLLAFAKANLARELTVKGNGHTPLFQQLQGAFAGHQNVVVQEAPTEESYRASFKIGQAQLRQLEVRISNFADGEKEVAMQQIEAVAGEQLIQSQDRELAKVSIEADGNDWVVSVETNPMAIPPGAYFVDFKTRKEDQSHWQPLKIADKHGQSESRLVICTRPNCASAQDAWGRTLNLAFLEPDVDEDCEAERAAAKIPAPELPQALQRLQQGLLFKYASPVWPAVQWLETALVRTCLDGYVTTDATVCQGFAEAAVISLACKAKNSLSIHSTLIFGSQPILLALAGVHFSPSTSENQIERAFGEIGKLAAANTFKEYVMGNISKGCAHEKLFKWFANLAEVAANRAKDFKGFDYQRYFDYLANEAQELDFKQAELNSALLLDAEHFLTVLRPLNRRFRPLEQTRNADDTGASLSRMMGAIQVMVNQLAAVAPTVKEHAGVPAYLEFSIPIRFAESALVQTVSDLLLTITGLGRLHACGRLNRDQFVRNLNNLLSPEGESTKHLTSRLCLLLSLAPELFAFYMLFWEAVLKPLAKNERN